MSNNTNIPDTVIERARKLMAMTAERGASEAEAAIAARVLQQMMAEYNLSLAHIEASGGSTQTGGGKRTRENVGRKQVYKWQRALMRAIADLNFCKSLERFRYKDRGPAIFDGYDLIGRIDNVTTATLMFDYLLATIERLARNDVANDPSQFFTRVAHSFKEGTADRLVDRLMAQKNEIVAEQERTAREAASAARHPGAAPTTLPALLSDVFASEADLNNDVENGWAPGTTARKRYEDDQRRAAEKVKREARRAEARARGYDDDVADWYAWGYTIEQALAMVRPRPDKPDKPETEAQRRRRQRQQERANDRYWRRHYREEARLDQGAYRRGQAAADDVSLNRQVGAGSNRNKLS